MNDFYTYAYLRMNGTPYYVGKGRNNRYKSANHKVNVPKDENRILFLKRHLTEEQAFIHEKYMIAVLGKKVDGGLLHNITDGGEGPSGLKHSSETKRRIGDAKRGRSLSEEHKEKLRRQKIGNTWNQGRVVPQEQKDKIRRSLKGVKHTEERKRNQSLSHLGKHWFNDGKTNRFCYECPDGFMPGRIRKEHN